MVRCCPLKPNPVCSGTISGRSEVKFSGPDVEVAIGAPGVLEGPGEGILSVLSRRAYFRYL